MPKQLMSIIAEKMKRVISAITKESITMTVEDILVQVLRRFYKGANDGVKVSIFNFLEEVLKYC